MWFFCISGLRPFKDYVWSALCVVGKESAVQPVAFLFQNANFNINSCIFQFLDTFSCNLFKWVDATDNDIWNAFADKHVGTGWCSSYMGTWFERYIFSADAC